MAHIAERRDAVGRRRRPGPVAALACVAAAPVVVASLAVIGARWFPSGDQALEMLRIRDVGGGNTPLVGAWSRWGYAHPGPWLFWLLAPFEWLFGAGGVLVGTGAVNAVSAGGAVLVAGRTDRRTATVVALATIALIASLGLSTVVDPWNPFVAVIPTWLYLVALWSACSGDRMMWPVALVAGSFAVQAHIGYLPVVGGTGFVAVVLVLLTTLADRGSSGREPQAMPAPERGPVLLLTAVAGAVMWLPVLVEQLTGPSGNISRIIDFLRSPPDGAWGWATASDVAGRQLGWRLPWITGADSDVDGFVGRDPVIWAALVLLVLATLGVLAWRRHERSSATMAGIAAGGIAVAALTTSRLTGVEAPYVVFWWRPLAALAATAMTLCSISLVVSHSWPARRWRRRAAILSSTAVAAAAVVVVIVGLPVRTPIEGLSDMLADVTGQLAGELDPDSTYVVTGSDLRLPLSASYGLVVALREDGIDARAAPGELTDLQFGDWRVVGIDEADAQLVVLSRESLEAGAEPPPGAVEIARHESLTAAERARRDGLEDSILADVAGSELAEVAGTPLVMNDLGVRLATEGGADPDEVEEFRELQQDDAGYVVYLVERTE